MSYRWKPPMLVGAMLVVLAGCNPGQPSPEFTKEAEARVKTMIGLMEAGKWDEAKKIYPDVEQHTNLFVNSTPKLDAAFNVGSTMKFVLRYRIPRSGNMEKFADFTFEKESGDKLKPGIYQIKVY
jgi:hypothetical protein